MGRIGAAPQARRGRTQEVLDWLLRNGRRETLCGEVTRITGAPHALVEDVVQEVCLLAATTGKCRGGSEGEVYNWLRTSTLRRVRRSLDRAYHRREILVGWSGAEAERVPVGDGVDAEVLERERERELAELARTICADLSERQRQVAALHSHGLAGREIARHLNTSERRVKHLKQETLARARDALAGAAGGGCEEGKPLISRLAFGLASPRERTQAQLHLTSCELCGALYQRLELWHQKVAALLPIPAAAHIEPSLLERVVHKSAHVVTQAKHQLSDAGSQAKQHAAASYYRTVDPTPLSGIRPGAAATVIASCLALGGGGAYCVERGVNPITSVIQPAPTNPTPQEPAQEPDPAEQPSDTPPPAVQQPPAISTPAPEPPAQPERQPAPPAPKPTPAGVQFGEPATPASVASSSPQPAEAPAPAQPAGATKNAGTDLYGP